MRFLFRTDASVELGTGHVARCATLARYLANQGHEVMFLCRELPGNFNRWLADRGFTVFALRAAAAADEQADAAICLSAIDGQYYDWLVVDHYGLNADWEKAMSRVANRIFAIDDLGRTHGCDLLLDQNYPSRTHLRYRASVPPDCTRLLGPSYALLRPEFARLRPLSAARPRMAINRIVVCMGGSDPLNETAKAVWGIDGSRYATTTVDVVIGAGNPHRASVESACAQLPRARLLVQAERMAELLGTADCAIGAGGTSTWERCAVAVPALVTILAENQSRIAESLDAIGAHRLLGRHDALAPGDYSEALDSLTNADLARMSLLSSALCDGNGTARVYTYLRDGALGKVGARRDRAAI